LQTLHIIPTSGRAEQNRKRKVITTNKLKKSLSDDLARKLTIIQIWVTALIALGTTLVAIGVTAITLLPLIENEAVKEGLHHRIWIAIGIGFTLIIITAISGIQRSKKVKSD
jgi:ABC-type Fe3+ transport system permease subunit